MTHRILTAAVLSMALSLSAPALCANQAKEQSAIQQAERWLAMVDGGRYMESWDEAATYFRNAVSKDQWTASMNAFRKPLGKVIERSLKSSRYVTSLPGAPDGEYVVIQFDTVFEEKAEAIETVTPMMDSDGAWRVSGYFVK